MIGFHMAPNLISHGREMNDRGKIFLRRQSTLMEGAPGAAAVLDQMLQNEPHRKGAGAGRSE